MMIYAVELFAGIGGFRLASKNLVYSQEYKANLVRFSQEYKANLVRKNGGRDWKGVQGEPCTAKRCDFSGIQGEPGTII